MSFAAKPFKLNTWGLKSDDHDPWGCFKLPVVFKVYSLLVCQSSLYLIPSSHLSPSIFLLLQR